MKRQMAGLTILAVMAGCAPSTRVQERQARSANETKTVESSMTGPKRRIGVIDFENKTNYGDSRIGRSATDILITELVKTDKFVVIERDKMTKLLDEQNMGKSGLINEATAAKAGKLLGLNAIVTGAISQFGAKKEGADYLLGQNKRQITEATVDIRVVDVETGEILYADSGKGVSTKKTGQVLGMGTRSSYDETMEGEALRAAIVQFTKNIVSQVNKKPWSCLVADVEGDEIFLNAGSSSGLATGSILDVYRSGRAIVDPTTGREIGHTETSLGQLEVVRHANENLSIGKMKGSAKAAPKDICRLKGS